MTKAKKETDSLINLRSARRPGDCGGALPGRPSNVCVGGELGQMTVNIWGTFRYKDRNR